MLNVFSSLLERPIIKPMIDPFYNKMLQMIEEEIKVVKKIVNESLINDHGMALLHLFMVKLHLSDESYLA